MKPSSHVAAKCAAMRAAKARKRESSAEPVREPTWTPPKLRRILVVIDYDSGRPMVRMMQLLRSNRIDSYRMRTPRGEGKKPVGWSRILAQVRAALPRVGAG